MISRHVNESNLRIAGFAQRIGERALRRSKPIIRRRDQHRTRRKLARVIDEIPTRAVRKNFARKTLRRATRDRKSVV